MLGGLLHGAIWERFENDLKQSINMLKKTANVDVKQLKEMCDCNETYRYNHMWMSRCFMLFLQSQETHSCLFLGYVKIEDLPWNNTNEKNYQVVISASKIHFPVISLSSSVYLLCNAKQQTAVMLSEAYITLAIKTMIVYDWLIIYAELADDQSVWRNSRV